MKKLRVPAVLALLLLLSAAVWFALGNTGANGGDLDDRPSEGDGAASVIDASAAAERDVPAAERAALTSGLDVEGARPVDATGGRIVGRVVGPDERPVAGARVQGTPSLGWDDQDADADFSWGDPAAWEQRARALERERVETRTGDDGSFAFVPGGRSRQVEVRVLARGCQVLDRTVRRPQEHEHDLGTLRLRAGAVVSGRVVDAAGEPLAGASVQRADPEQPILPQSVMNGDRMAAVTDAAGRFELEHVGPGDFALHARHAKHPPTRSTGLRVAAGEVLADLLLRMDPAAQIAGRVLNPPPETTPLRVLAKRRNAGRDPRGFAELGDQAADVGREGEFTVPCLVAGGEYDVWVAQRVPGWPGVAAAGPTVQVRAGATAVELRYEPGVTVTFIVVDAGTAQPIERLWVTHQLRGDAGNQGWFGGPAVRASDYAGGRVIVAGLRPKPKQTLSLQVDAIGHLRWQRDGIELPLAGSKDLGTVQLTPAPVVRVHVIDPDGEGVPGATVRMTRRDRAQRNPFEAMLMGASGPRTARTDADGRCTINAETDVALELAVVARDFAPYYSDEITVAADGDGVECEVRLGRGGSVAVEAVDDRGAQLANASVVHADAKDHQDTREADAQGRVLFDHLAPGTHRFRLRERGEGGGFRIRGLDLASTGGVAAPASWTAIEVEDEVRSSLRVTRAPAALVTGVVRDGGEPLAKAQVAWLRGNDTQEQPFFFGDGAAARASTDGEGRFTLEGLTAGEHRLRVTHEGRAMPATVPVTLAVGANVVDLDLESTGVRGMVRDQDGHPIAKARVRAEAVRDGGGIRFGMEWAGQGAPRGPGTVETDAEGRYHLRGVASGAPLVVRAAAPGWVAATTAPLHLARGETKDGVDLVVLAGGKIAARAPADLENAWLQARHTEAGAAAAPASARLVKGAAELADLRPGRWRVTLMRPGQEGETRDVEVVAGKTVAVVF